MNSMFIMFKWAYVKTIFCYISKSTVNAEVD